MSAPGRPPSLTRTAATGRTASARGATIPPVTDTTPPAVPTNVAAANGSNSIVVTWDANSEPDLDGYYVWRAPSSAGTKTLLTVTRVTGQSYIDSTAVGNTTYWYFVTASDALGNTSGFSAPGSGSWSPPSPAAIIPATPVVSATFESISVEVTYTGDANLSASMTLEARVNGTSPWKLAQPLRRGDDGTYKAFNGSVMFCLPNTLYDIRVVVTCPDGGGTTFTQTAAVTTRAENIPAASSLTVTHYVNAATGADSGAGTTTGAPWATIEYARANAPSGAVVQVAGATGGQFYLGTNTARTTPWTIMADPTYAAVDDTGAIIHTGNHVVLEDQRGSAPTGAATTGINTGLTVAPWVLQTSIGGYNVTGLGVYKWAAAPPAVCNWLGVATTRAGTPIRVPNAKSTSTWTDAQRAQFHLTNQRYHYGFWTGKTSAKDIYLRLPAYCPSTNPNALYVSLGEGGNALLQSTVSGSPVDGANVRVSGFEMRGADYSVKVNVGSSYAVVDHNLFCGAWRSMSFESTKPPNPVYGNDHVVQYNRFQDSGLRSAPGVTAVPSLQYIPWGWIKGNDTAATGIGTLGTVGDTSQCNAVWAKGMHRRVVIRYNYVDGTFNAFGGQSTGYDHYAGADCDIYSNTIRNVADDCFEWEPNAINWRIWDNDIAYVKTVLSINSACYGPTFLVFNRIWRISNTETPQDIDGSVNVACLLVKIRAGQTVLPHVLLAHNTVWTDQPGKGWQITNGSGPLPYFRTYNNVIRVYYRVTEFDSLQSTANGHWVEDNNWFAVQDTATSSGVKNGSPTVYRTPAHVATYRTNTGGAASTNKAGATTYGFDDYTTLDAQFTSPLTGNLTPKNTALFLNKAVNLDNITDRGGTRTALGSAFDMGDEEVA